MSQAGETHLRRRFAHAAQLEQNSAWLDHGRPKLRLALALSHAGFKRNGRDRLVRKHANVKLAFAADVLLSRDAPGFDRRRAQPAAVLGLQAEFAEDNPIA